MNPIYDRVSTNLLLPTLKSDLLTQLFTLNLLPYLKPLFQDAARTRGMRIVEWVTWVLESADLASCTSSAAQPINKTEHQFAKCRSP